MFQRKSLSVFLFAMLAIATSVFGQGDAFLEHFSVIETDGGVLLNWTTRMGNTCNGIDILRSTDSIHFEEVGHIAGICGSPGASQAFTFTDLNPAINHRNFYKLNLGSVGVSSVRALDIVELRNGGALIVPHPVTDRARLYVENAAHSRCALTLVDRQGIVRGVQETTAEYFDVEGRAYPNGLYFFKVVNAEGMQLATGKLLLVAQ